MRKAVTGIIATLLLTVGGMLTWSFLPGQARKSNPRPGVPQPVKAPKLDRKLAPLARLMYLSSQRGADWLLRSNRPDGRFEYGWLPALGANMDGDHFLRQVGAAFALARAARLTKNKRYAAVAKQSLLTLLLQTTTTKHPSTQQLMRHTTLPSIVVNRLGSAGLLVLAIHELPDPGEDLLAQSDQLCLFIREQQRADGSLAFTDPSKEGQAVASVDPDGINYYPGEALYGLMHSNKRQPQAWKTELIARARPYYMKHWRAHKNMPFVPWQTAAFAEAYLQTKDKAYAEAVFEMADWICTLQYTRIDPRHPLWMGGFMGYIDGKPAPAPPQIGSASYAEGLAEACRVAREVGDLQRFQRYRDALERCLQFLTTLQYTDARTQHFADWYRPRLVGGFHASHQDGNLRIDYTQHAICAMARYVSHVAD